MRRTTLVGKIRQRANEVECRWTLARQGKRHEVWWLGSGKLSIPRHREINEMTAEGILKDTETELGEGWWR